MKSLSEIYYSHKNWLADERHPNIQVENIIHAEMADEADQYVKDLTALKENWRNVLKYDVSGLAPYDFCAKVPYINEALNSPLYEKEESVHGFDPWKSFDGISYHCNDGGFTDEEYMYIKHVDLVEDFFTCIQDSIRRFFGEDIDIIQLAKRESDTTTPEPEQTALDNSLEDVPPANRTSKQPTSTDADTKDNGKKGRLPAPPFKDYFKNSEDADIILPILHELLDGKKGTIRAKYMIAISKVWLNESPAHQSVHNEFNDGKKDSTYETRFMRHYCDYSTLKRKAFSDDELSDVIKLLKQKSMNNKQNNQV